MVIPVVADPLTSQIKTLDRLHDPVIVRTSLLGDLPDHSTARCRLYAARHGKLEPIPYQFDQRGKDGELVLSESGEDRDFTFDDDELVFMAKDAGDRLAAVEEPGADAALEIEVTDPTSRRHAWAYLVHFRADPPPPSPVRYATFDSARQEARALYYEVSYSRSRGNYPTGIRIASAAGGTGAPLVERIRMRVEPEFSLLGATWRASFTEESFTVVPDGLRNGAVRAVRRVRQSLDLGKWCPDIPSGRVYSYYYFSSFTTPSTFRIPWLVLKALRDFRFESINELGPQTADLRYWDRANPDGVRFSAGNRPVASEDDHDWWVMSSSEGSFLHALTIPQRWLAWGIRRGVVFDDGTPQPDGAWCDTGAGYSLRGMTNLHEAGAYDLDSTFVVFPHPYRPGEEEQALSMLHAPLTLEVRPVSADTAASGRAVSWAQSRTTPEPQAAEHR
jgi:hypothetical protein